MWSTQVSSQELLRINKIAGENVLEGNVSLFIQSVINMFNQVFIYTEVGQLPQI